MNRGSPLNNLCFHASLQAVAVLSSISIRRLPSRCVYSNAISLLFKTDAFVFMKNIGSFTPNCPTILLRFCASFAAESISLFLQAMSTLRHNSQGNQ